MTSVSQRRTFKPHPHGDERRAFLQQLILYILNGSLDAKYKEKLLDDVIWKYTEADGKWNLRYCSKSTSLITKNQELRHEHVHTKRSLKKRLLECATAEDVGIVMQDAIACIVSKDEHLKLSKFDKTHGGWQRYVRAGVGWIEITDVDERPTKVCPECGHVFRGLGWDGIDAHWKSKHEHILPYAVAWPQISAGTYTPNPNQPQ